MSIYLQSANQYRILSDEAVIVTRELKPAVYSINMNPMTGEMWLERIKDFTLPEKVYGANPRYAERIMRTFEARTGSTGVHLDGVKGSGKTLLSKQLSLMAVEKGYPVIVVNQPLAGENFNRFIQSIDTPSVILFDEFEKVYDDQKLQGSILTLFDGVYSSKKLFILTTNESWKVSDYMKNRPGRMFYSLSFDSLDPVAIREYLDDNLNNKERIEEVVRYTSVYTFFNFDMLAAVVEEMNRYDESLADVLKFMNVKPEIHKMDTFAFTVHFKDNSFVYSANNGFDPNDFSMSFNSNFLARKLTGSDKIHPTTSEERLAFMQDIESMEAQLEATDLFDDCDDVLFEMEDMEKYDHNRGQFIFKKGEGDNAIYLVITRNQRKQPSYMGWA